MAIRGIGDHGEVIRADALLIPWHAIKIEHYFKRERGGGEGGGEREREEEVQKRGGERFGLALLPSCILSLP